MNVNNSVNNESLPAPSPESSGSGGPAPGSVLGPRALNRALLARQLLLRRSEMSAYDALEQLAGLQAQAPNPPYFGLWTRLAGFRQEQLSQLILERRAVRIALMRSTIHLVTDRDCLALRPVLQPMLERAFQHSASGKLFAGLDAAAVAAAGRELLAREPLTASELGALLAERWPGRDPAALASAVRTYVPLAQVPPRAIWGAGGQAAHADAEQWLGRPLDANAAPEPAILRYLRAFGPATVKDMQVWSGLTRLREAVERLRPQLVAFRDEKGGELFDLPDAPRPDPDTPAPPRYLAEFDNMLLSYDDRSRIISEESRARVFTVNGIIRATVLVDGFVRGMWRIERKRGEAELAIELFAPVGDAARQELAAEGERLLAFAAEETERRTVRFEGSP